LTRRLRAGALRCDGEVGAAPRRREAGARAVQRGAHPPVGVVRRAIVRHEPLRVRVRVASVARGRAPQRPVVSLHYKRPVHLQGAHEVVPQSQAPVSHRLCKPANVAAHALCVQHEQRRATLSGICLHVAHNRVIPRRAVHYGVGWDVDRERGNGELCVGLRMAATLEDGQSTRKICRGLHKLIQEGLVVEVEPALVSHPRERWVPCQTTRKFDTRPSSGVVVVDREQVLATHRRASDTEAPVLLFEGRLHHRKVGRRCARPHLFVQARRRLLAACVYPRQDRSQERGARRPHLRAAVDRHRRVHLPSVVQRPLDHRHHHQVGDALKGRRHPTALSHSQRLLAPPKLEEQLVVDGRPAVQPVAVLAARLEHAAKLISHRVQQHAGA